MLLWYYQLRSYYESIIIIDRITTRITIYILGEFMKFISETAAIMLFMGLVFLMLAYVISGNEHVIQGIIEVLKESHFSGYMH